MTFLPISTRSTRMLPDRYSTINQVDSVRNKSRTLQARPSSGRAQSSLVGEFGRWGWSSWSDRQWEPTFS